VLTFPVCHPAADDLRLRPIDACDVDDDELAGAAFAPVFHVVEDGGAKALTCCVGS
jgi:hypothetical protein